MPEIRFEAKTDTIAVLDGYCSATGKCRTAFINDLLEQWATAKLYEATLVCRVAGINPTAPDIKGNHDLHAYLHRRINRCQPVDWTSYQGRFRP